MNYMTKAIAITLIVGLAAFFVGPNIWHPASDVMPTASQIPFFIILSVIDSLSFGAGVAFIYLGRGLMKNPQIKNAKAVFVSLVWLIISWWPHDNFHMANGLNMQGLLYIEYGFHVTLIIAGIIVGFSLVSSFYGKKN